MTSYYLRVAGTNFDSFVADTQDLSTIRGGSLLLRAMIGEVGAIDGGLEPVTTGASEGLFRFEAEDDAGAENVRRRVEAGLPARIEALRHATFTVDWVRDRGDFRRERQKAVALGRWRQMQSPSLAVPSPAGAGAGPCAADRLRPASGERTLRELPTSESVYRRREHGRRLKQDFYERETGQGGEPGIRVEAGYSHDLERLTAAPERGNLDGKMAVLYLDGNAFGALQDRHVRSAADQTEFDRVLQESRRGVLRELVGRALAMAAMREGGDGPIRLETLIWGGDEMAWVLPGWAGLWAVDLFFRDPLRFGFRGETLTHAAGLVLCHHGAPIHRMRELAERLAGLAKAGDRGRNLLAYEVLESYDDVGDDFERYRARRRPPGAGPRIALLAAEAVGAAVANYGAVAAALPSRQVHRAAGALFRGDAGDFEQALDQIRASLAAAGKAAAFERLLRALGGAWSAPGESGDPGWPPERAGVFHLAALMDYLEPIREDGDG